MADATILLGCPEHRRRRARRVTDSTKVRTSGMRVLSLGEFFADWSVPAAWRPRIKARLQAEGWACGGDIERIELI